MCGNIFEIIFFGQGDTFRGRLFHLENEEASCVMPYLGHRMILRLVASSIGSPIGAAWRSVNPSPRVATSRYFNGEKSVGRMYVESIFSTSLLACSDFITSSNPGSAISASQFFFASSWLGWAKISTNV